MWLCLSHSAKGFGEAVSGEVPTKLPLLSGSALLIRALMWSHIVGGSARC